MATRKRSAQEFHLNTVACLPHPVELEFCDPRQRAAHAGSEALRSPLACEILRLHPIGTLIEKRHGNMVIQGQLCDHSGNYWRILDHQKDWEEFRTGDGAVREEVGTSWSHAEDPRG